MPARRMSGGMAQVRCAGQAEKQAMKTKTLILTLAACLAGSAVLSFGQSLADLARKERAKEGSQPKAAKVYTNDNIPHSTTMQESPSPASAESAPKPAEEKTPETAGAATSAPSQPAEAEKPAEDKMKTKAYWQGKFAEAQANLDKADEELKLAQDELSLEQMDQARELDPEKKAQLDGEVAAKQGAAQSSREAYDKAKQALEKLKQEFDESGAPKDWLPADEKQ
jgi:hypothetical protein